MTPEDLSEGTLKFASWWIAHRALIKKIGIGVLVAADVALVGYNFWQWADYAILGARADKDLLREISLARSNVAELQAHFGPKEIFLESVDALPAGDRTDAVAIVQNPNAHHAAVITYRFVLDGVSGEARTATVLPGGRKVLARLGERGRVQGATVKVESVAYARISTHILPDPISFIADRAKFEISDFKFYAPNAVPGVDTSIATFTIENATSYSFWKMPLFVFFKFGDRVGGVEYTELSQWKSGEKRFVDLRPKGVGAAPSSIEILPDFNPLDPAAFMPPAAQ